MLVLNAHFSLLASLLVALALSSASPSPSAHGAVIRVARDTEGPTTTTLADGSVSTTKSLHQDRPSKLDLPDGAEPSSAASRKGMSKGNRWGNADAARTRTWTGARTGTRTWERPASTGNPAPVSDDADDDDSEELSKRDFTRAKQGVVIQPSRGRHHSRRSSQRGLAGKHRFGRHFRRRDISIDSDRGDRYVVQKDRTRTPTSAYRQQRFMVRRKVPKGTPGVINIMSHVNNAPSGKKIAALYLESEKKNGQYVLNASEKDSTEVYLVPTVPSFSGPHKAERRDDSKAETLVSLRVELEGQEYCATYDPNPPEAEPLTMQPCMEAADDSSSDAQLAKDVDGAKDRNPDNHKSQTFSFNPDSGVIRPMWFAGEDDGKTDDGARASEVSDDAASSSVALASSTPTPTAADSDASPSPSPVSSAVAAADTPIPTPEAPSPSSDPASAAPAAPAPSIAAREPSAAQNVTLVFVPSPKSGTNAVGDDSSSLAPLASASPVPSQAASAASDEATSTFTETVTVTAESAGASMTPTPSVDSSDDDSASSTTTITISASALPSSAPSSSGDAQGSLSVQVVGDDGKTIGDDDPSTANPPMDDDSSAAPSAAASLSAAAVGAPAAPSAPAIPAPTPSVPLPANPLITKAPALPVNPMAVASEVAQFPSQSAGAAETDAAPASPSATPSQTAPDALKSEVIAVKSSRTINSRIAKRQLTPVSTAPYKWLFKLGGI